MTIQFFTKHADNRPQIIRGRKDLSEGSTFMVWNMGFISLGSCSVIFEGVPIN